MMAFNMFHTAQTPYNIVDATRTTRMSLKLMQQACGACGLKFGVYYSSSTARPGASAYIPGNSKSHSTGDGGVQCAQ